MKSPSVLMSSPLALMPLVANLSTKSPLITTLEALIANPFLKELIPVALVSSKG